MTRETDARETAERVAEEVVAQCELLEGVGYDDDTRARMLVAARMAAEEAHASGERDMREKAASVAQDYAIRMGTIAAERGAHDRPNIVADSKADAASAIEARIRSLPEGES